MAAPSYRERLRIEGFTMAGLGAAASIGLWRGVPASRRWPLNTLGQIAVAGALMARLGRKSVRRAMDEAVEVQLGAEGGGEPTPLWQLPLIMAALALAFGEAIPRTGLPGSDRAGWDAGLRITGGCLV